MKLFGNSSGQHVRRDSLPPDPVPETPTEQKPTPAAPTRTATAVLERPPEPVKTPVVPEPEPPVPSEKPKKGHFLLGYLIYVVVFLLLIGAGLTVLWLRMDAYERSRPYRPMDALLESTSAESWRSQLKKAGVEDSFLDTLELSAANYTKKLDEYTDERPVYSIRFGKKTMLTATLKQNAPLRFGFTEWMLDSLTLVDSGLTVYAPENAVVWINGEAVGEDCLVERNAQSVTLGPLEAARTDIPGLSKYVLNRCFSADGITVTDALGNTLELGMQKGKAYYYPPLTSGYIIEAPSAVTVTVNGIALTEENAEITSIPIEDFEGLDDSVPVHPADVTYVIDGLVAVPEVQALFDDGSSLSPAETAADRWTFRLEPDAEFGSAMEERILKVFDAYIAFLGNRNGDLNGNYQRYLNYLVPGSEAATRAQKSLGSLYWVQGRDTTLDSVSVGDVICYGDECFTAWLDFTRRLLDGGEDNASYLFLFVRYNNEWRVVRVMNKTSFIRN